MPILLKDQTSDRLHASLADAGVSLHLARRLLAAAVKRGELPAPGSGLTARLRGRTAGCYGDPSSDAGAEDRLAGGRICQVSVPSRGAGQFEAVRIPLLHRANDCKYVACISSQVGCAMGCVFCATGRMGFGRNLAPWEMVDQVVKLQADSPHPIRGVVFMGMGEPMLNYDAVMTAIGILSEPCGMAIAAKAITVSTVGIIPGIRRFTAERQRARLVVSLTAADPGQRRELLPIEARYPTPELLAALREYHDVSGQRVTLAWTMISGVNVGEADAVRLAELTRGLPMKLDLIDVNDPTGRYRPPSPAELDVFRDALRAQLGMPVARRYSGGQDIHAGCGMLAACPK
jgi:23S rRNA (adenine2503-C2)-methyltransferase